MPARRRVAPGGEQPGSAGGAKHRRARDRLDAHQGRRQDAVKSFKKAAKYAPAKVKSAIDNITKYLSVIVSGDASNIADLTKSGTFKNYTKSLSTYISYYTSNCVGS